jgi:hypothetical protein
MAQSRSSGEKNVVAVGVTAWLLPGAGHWFLGLRRQGVIICLTIWLTFILGALLAGVGVIGPRASAPWFAAQICGGLPAILGTVLGRGAEV